MALVTVVGGTFAGVAAAARLACVGHQVTLVEPDAAWPDRLRAQLGETLDFPAPWRDLFKKSGRPAVGALGRHGLELVGDTAGRPTDRGAQWRLDVAELGEPAAGAWRDLVDAADDVWQALRPLDLEAERTPSTVARSGLHPRRSLEQVARDLRHRVLAARVRAVASERGLNPRDAPAWLTSRLAIERTFGRWRLVDAAGASRPASALVDVLLDRLVDRGVLVVDLPAGPRPDAVIDTRDPGLVWHRPRPLRARDSFVDQLADRPPIRVPGKPGWFAASASGAGGNEPWAQLLAGALATYAAHEHLTGEDIRPTNRKLG